MDLVGFKFDNFVLNYFATFRLVSVQQITFTSLQDQDET